MSSRESANATRTKVDTSTHGRTCVYERVSTVQFTASSSDYRQYLRWQVGRLWIQSINRPSLLWLYCNYRRLRALMCCGSWHRTITWSV